MKTNMKLVVAVGVMALATGCTDLDVPLKSQYPEYPNTEIARNAQMNGIYSHFRGGVGGGARPGTKKPRRARAKEHLRELLRQEALV